MTTKVEIRVMKPQALELLEPLETRRYKEQILPGRFQKEHDPGNTLISV